MQDPGLWVFSGWNSDWWVVSESLFWRIGLGAVQPVRIWCEAGIDATQNRHWSLTLDCIKDRSRLEELCLSKNNPPSTIHHPMNPIRGVEKNALRCWDSDEV
jgi:hypothetical protein